MKAAMMIKALIIVHLWSLIVAGAAWALQRDGAGRVGAHFPTPTIWLLLIMLCLLPGSLHLMPFDEYISIQTIEALEIFSIQVNNLSADGARPLNILAVYLIFGGMLMGRTLWRWARLQSVPLTPSAEPDVFTTQASLPPLTLSWPRRAVVMPQGVEVRDALLRHERAHLRHNDAELTLLLLLLQDIMLRNPGLCFLVRQWRLSIELRADRAATNKLTIQERKDYAALLLSIQRPAGSAGKALPCPTARLASTHHRNAKMRVIGILENAPNTQKPRWGVALFFTSMSASALGLTSAIATVGENVIDGTSGPINYAARTPLETPARCPGLIRDLKRRDVKVEDKELMVNGQLILQRTMNVGTVVLRHDVSKDGSIDNPAIIKSTHPCFEANAKASIAQWMARPQETATKNVVVKMPFIITGATVEDLNLQLKSLDQ